MASAKMLLGGLEASSKKSETMLWLEPFVVDSKDIF